MLKETVKKIADDLKNKHIESIYFTGLGANLNSYIPCKFIVDREVTNTVAEIIDIYELITRKPNRLNENALVIFACDLDFEDKEMNEINIALKERNVEVILVSDKDINKTDMFDFHLRFDNSKIELCMASALLLLTSGILHQREPSVYPKLYSGMEENIEKLHKFSEAAIESTFQSMINIEKEINKINIIASGTDVTTQEYLASYFIKQGKQIKKIQSGDFINYKKVGKTSNELYLLIFGMDASKELDANVFQKLNESLPVKQKKVFEVKNIENITILDRPFAKVISSIFIFYAMNKQMKET